MPHSQLDEVHHAKVALAQLRNSGSYPAAAEALHGLIVKHEALQEKHRALEGKPPPAHKQVDNYSQQLPPVQEKQPTAGEKAEALNAQQQEAARAEFEEKARAEVAPKGKRH